MWDILIKADPGFPQFQVQNLEPPWGVCGKSDLTYYSSYSVPACNMDCENTFIRSQCACRDVHMPDIGGEY